MASHAKARTGASYASRKPGLREGMPEGLRRAGSTRTPFDHARDPWLSKQLKAEKQSEAKRRETGDGSKMVKLHKPFPELRPKQARGPIRDSFNRAWLREERAAQMQQFEAQARHMQSEAQHQQQQSQQQQTYSGPKHSRSR